jgi:hypothetical protein
MFLSLHAPCFTTHDIAAVLVLLQYSFVTPLTSLVVVRPNDSTHVEPVDASRPGDRTQWPGALLA